MSNQKHYFCTTAKLTFWLFENPSIYIQIWAKQVRGVYPVHIWQ
jgi:hypothetical protein